MLLSYDSEGDVLEVIFQESLHLSEQIAYELRDGIILYVDVLSQKPVQLTLVNYLGLARIPVVLFKGWQKLSASKKKRLLPILAAPPVSNFLKLDPQTGAGHISSPGMPEIFALAA